MELAHTLNFSFLFSLAKLFFFKKKINNNTQLANIPELIFQLSFQFTPKQ
jgi:hypothetical protein